MESPDALPPDSFGFRDEGGVITLVVRHAGSVPFRADAGAFDHGIRGEGSHVVIDGLDVEVSQWANIFINGTGGPWTVRNLSVRYGWGSNKKTPGAGVEIRSAQGSLVDNVTVRDAHGDGIFIRCPRVTVQNCRIYTVFKGFNPGGDSIQFSSGNTDGFRILNNWMTQQGTDTPKGCVQQEFGDGGIVRGNTVLYGVFGIEVNGNNILIEDNVIGFSGMDRKGQDPFSAGIYMSEHRGYENVTIRNNIIFGCDQSGISLDATNGKKMPPYNRSQFRILSNTIVDCRFGIRTTVPFSGEIRNNALAGIRQHAFEIESLVPGESLAMDHNIVSGASPALIRIASLPYRDFADHFDRTGLSADSQVAEIRFKKPGLEGLELSSPDAMLPDFSPAEGSVLVDSGVFVGRRHDRSGQAVPQGNGVDVGAVESSFSAGEPGPAPAAPRDFEAYGSAPDKVTLRWASPEPDVAGFEVHRSTTANFTPSEKTLRKEFVPRGPWQDHGLMPGETAHYAVRAINRSGEISEPVFASASPVPSVPGALAAESFGYPESMPLAGLNGGRGFAGPWEGGHKSTIVQGWTTGGPVAAAGGALELKTSMTRKFAAPLDAGKGPLWLGVALSPGHRSKSVRIILKNGEEPVVALQVGGSQVISVNGVRAAEPAAEGMQHYLLRMEGGEVALWRTERYDAGEPGSPDLNASVQAGAIVDRVALEYSNPQENRGLVDEIRVGRTIESVLNENPPDAIPPEAPHVVKARATGTSRVEIIWNPACEEDVTEYEVYRVASVDAPLPDRPLATVKGTSFMDASAPGPGPVYYRVLAKDRSGNRSKPGETLSVPLWPMGKRLLAYEPFSQKAGENAVRGFGWASDAWEAGSGKVSFSGEGMNYPGVELHGGKILVVGGTSRGLAAPLPIGPGEPLWIGFIISERNSGREGSVSLVSNGARFLKFAHQPGSLLRVNQEKLKKEGASGTHFVLIQLSGVAGGTVAKVWVDPGGTEEPEAQPDAEVSLENISTLDGFEIGHNPASLFYVEVDEIRVGRSAADARVGSIP